MGNNMNIVNRFFDTDGTTRFLASQKRDAHTLIGEYVKALQFYEGQGGSYSGRDFGRFYFHNGDTPKERYYCSSILVLGAMPQEGSSQDRIYLLDYEGCKVAATFNLNSIEVSNFLDTIFQINGEKVSWKKEFLDFGAIFSSLNRDIYGTDYKYFQ